MVLGGAGYGKSHAVYSYLQKQRIPAIWIQFTERDNIGERFWENFTQSISMISAKSAAKLKKQGFPATDQQFERYLAIPLADINPRIKLIFVYDDFHLIHNQTVLRFMEHSITTPFPNITSILISRKELSINLMKFYSKGLLAALTQEDLRFSRDEVEAFFSMLGISAPVETLDSVYRDTEGWAFAIHLAGLYFKQNPSGEGFGNQIRMNIYKLIESEIMERLDPAFRKFLIKLSLIGASSPDLIRELARLRPEGNSAEGPPSSIWREPSRNGPEQGDSKGMEGRSTAPAKRRKEGAEELIRQIGKLGSFICFDEYRNAFNIHRLFRDYLSSLREELGEDEKKDLYRTAAAWCIRNNLKMDAIMYYEKAGDYVAVITLINTLPVNLSPKTMDSLVEVMERLPQDIWSEYIESHVLLVRFVLNRGQITETAGKLQRLIEVQEARPESKSRDRVLFSCYMGMGFLHKILAVFSGDYSFPGYFARGHLYKESWGGEIEGPFTSSWLGSYVCRVGADKPGPGEPEKMDRYIEALAAASPDLIASMGGNSSGLEELARGERAFFRMQMREAEGFLRAALIKAREFRQYETESRSCFYLMRIGFFQGSAAMINESLEAVKALLDREEYINRHVHCDICCGWYHAQMGNCGNVPPWLKQESGESGTNSLIRGQELLVRARSCFREKDYLGALFALGQTTRNAYHFLVGRIEVKTLEAACLYQMKDKHAAYRAMEEACRLAEPGGFYTPFAELGKDMRSLVSQALKDKTPAGSAEKNAISCPEELLERIRCFSALYSKKQLQVSEELSGSPGLSLASAGLSHREYDVLTGLFQGLTQEEIARFSSRSVNTVKSVIKRIYEKLGALNRADAIRIAINRGLLDWDGSGAAFTDTAASSKAHPKPGARQDREIRDHPAGRPPLLKRIFAAE
jgi:LuxR family maltose regulon positive regulatory protein